MLQRMWNLDYTRSIDQIRALSLSRYRGDINKSKEIHCIGLQLMSHQAIHFKKVRDKRKENILPEIKH
jgi:hypothetical protein